MISTAQELVDKMLKYFPKTDKVSEEMMDALKAYCRRSSFNDMELDRFYDLLTEHCEYFPVVKTAAKIWKEYGQRAEKVTVSFASRAIADNKHSGWETIINDIKRIRSKKEYSALTNAEIDILHDYEDLSTIYNMLNAVPDVIMPEQYKATYLRKVKEDVDNHIPVNLTAARARIDKRIHDYNVMYGLEESEAAEKSHGIAKSFGQMQKAFSERKQILEDEPDKQMNLVV